MKTLLLTAATGIIFAFTPVNAQDDAISRFLEKYQGDNDFTQVNITSRMLGLFTDMEVNDEEDQQVLDAISKIDELKILAKEHASDGKILYKEVLSKLPKGEFNELMSIRDGDCDMKFMIKEKGNIISELLLIAGADDEFFIMSIVGDIDLKQISRLSEKINIGRLKNLKKLKENSK